MKTKMKAKTLFICLVLVSALIIGITVAMISEDLFKKEANTKEKEQETNVSWVIASEDPLLGKYEKSNLTFRRMEDNKLIKYLHRYRTIDGLLVKWDYKDYIFDKKTGDLILKEVRWRDDLPEHVPEKIISKKEAESIAKSVAKGKIMNTSYAHTHLCFISSQAEFPIEPMPKNPCWIVYFADDRGYNIDVIVIEAVNGKVLGHGVPFP